VVHAIRHGMSNRAIARRFGVSFDAIKYHVSNALGKLSLDKRAELRHWHGAPIDSAPRKGSTMEEAKLVAVGQISRQVRDIDAAVSWYRDVLGLQHLFTFGTFAFFDCGGVRLYLAAGEREGGGFDDSILYFQTRDIEAAHRRLEQRGVRFLGAPHLIHRHDSGVEEWMAFFEDLDGKVLALMSQVARTTDAAARAAD